MTDNARNTALPMDVVHDIIGQLANPPNKDAYVHEPGVVAALCSMCLVSRDVHRWSVRQLYRRISITSDNQLTLLLATGMPHRSFNRSLHLEGFGAGLKVQSIGRLLLIVGPVVERLMVDHLDVVITNYFLEAGPEEWLNGDDFRWMPALQEVVFFASSGVYTQFPNLRPILSERWPKLQRLAFYGGLFNTTNLLKGLKVLIFPWSWDTSSEMLHQIIDNHPALQRLVILIHNLLAPWYAFIISTPQKRAIAQAHQGRLSISQIYHPHKEEEKVERSRADYSWLAEHSRRGTVWELSGQDWLSLE